MEDPMVGLSDVASLDDVAQDVVMELNVSPERRAVLQKLANVFETGGALLPGQPVNTELSAPAHTGVQVDEEALKRRMAQYSKGVAATQHRKDRTLPGVPIYLELAAELRSVVFGTTIHPVGREWCEEGFLAAPPRFPFGLKAFKTGSKGLILCVQAYLLKSLLFKISYERGSDTPLTEEDLMCSEEARQAALVDALSDILCQAAMSSTSYTSSSSAAHAPASGTLSVCLLGNCSYFESQSGYRSDGFTERIRIVQLKSKAELKPFLYRHLSEFTTAGAPGCLQFLYSLALTKGLDRLRMEMGECHSLLGDYEEMTFTGLNLLLTGRAVPHFHNGIIRYGGEEQEELLEVPLRGAMRRSQVGLMYWARDKDPKLWPKVGSMLKTPLYPIWVTVINGRPSGVLFSLKPGLVNDWRVENLFSLYYYSGGSEHITQPAPSEGVGSSDPVVTVASGSLALGGVITPAPRPPPRLCRLEVNSRLTRVWPKSRLMREEAERRTPAVEHCVLTKWADAEVDWNCKPFL